MLPLANYFGEWTTKPFSEDMDWYSWMVFIAFVVTVAYLWMQILRYIVEEV